MRLISLHTILPDAYGCNDNLVYLLWEGFPSPVFGVRRRLLQPSTDIFVKKSPYSLIT